MKRNVARHRGRSAGVGSNIVAAPGARVWNRHPPVDDGVEFTLPPSGSARARSTAGSRQQRADTMGSLGEEVARRGLSTIDEVHNAVRGTRRIT